MVNPVEDSIFIFGNVPSSKNSKVWTGRFLVNSKTVTAYKKIAVPQFQANCSAFREIVRNKVLPLDIEFSFVRDSKRLFDFVNMAQIVLDLMQEYGWIEDDNYLNVVPHFNPEVRIDKENCGVSIKIL